ncbi:MAG: 30S ribosomal protein S9 [Parcubacteria group bacterium]|nr:30S ribosomal protein S9 [Parcubacteria group bacterium]
MTKTLPKKSKIVKTVRSTSKPRSAVKAQRKEVKEVVVEEPKKEVVGEYREAVGGRKESVVRVRIFDSHGEVKVNEKSVATYFPILEFQNIVLSPLKTLNLVGKVRVLAKVRGGGLRGQAEALRLALSRALVTLDPDFRKRLKKVGFLRRDARVKERKKYGLKKARRAPQWQKR